MTKGRGEGREGRKVPSSLLWFSRPLALSPLLLLLLFLSGCVYLRLLKVKNQLRDFDAHFSIGGRPSWILEFKTPVLYAKDAVFLIGAPPLSVSTTTAGKTYDYEFEMVRSTPSVPAVLERLSLRVRMRDKMLQSIEVPEAFLLYFSRRVMEETLRQAKDAEVVEIKRLARAAVRLPPEADVELPSLDRTRLLLGDPLEIVEGVELSTWVYRYRIVGDKKAVPIVARLSFGPDGALRRAVITWDASTVDASFIRE